jgi:hypothetical protein
MSMRGQDARRHATRVLGTTISKQHEEHHCTPMLVLARTITIEQVMLKLRGRGPHDRVVPRASARPNRRDAREHRREGSSGSGRTGRGWNGSVAAYATVRGDWAAEARLRGQYRAQLYMSEAPAADVDVRVEARLAAQCSASPEQDLFLLGSILASQWIDPAQGEILLLNELNYEEPFDVSSSTAGSAISAAEAAGVDPLPVARAVQTLALLLIEARLVAWPIIWDVPGSPSRIGELACASPCCPTRVRAMDGLRHSQPKAIARQPSGRTRACPVPSRQEEARRASCARHRRRMPEYPSSPYPALGQASKA